MTRTRIALAAAVALAAAGVAIAVGRWEAGHRAAIENAEMAAVLARVGPLRSSLPTGYRFGSVACLAYPMRANRFGLQVCFDESGRLVETVDRSGVQPRYASLTDDPTRATTRVSRRLVDRLLLFAQRAQH